MGVVRRRQLKKVITYQRAMTNEGRQFFKKNRVTPSVSAPGYTNPSDTTVFMNHWEDSKTMFQLIWSCLFLLMQHTRSNSLCCVWSK